MSRLMFGVTGTHGSGKTTLCEAYVKAHPEAHFIKTSASDVYKMMGLDPKEKMPLSIRLDVQEAILVSFIGQWSPALIHDVVITDRTPYDLMAYTLAELSGYDEVDEELDERIRRYLDSCYQVASIFTGIVHVPMGLPVAADPTGKVRASLGLGYRTHIDVLLKGLTDQVSNLWEVSELDLDERVRQLHGAIVYTQTHR